MLCALTGEGQRNRRGRKDGERGDKERRGETGKGRGGMRGRMEMRKGDRDRERDIDIDIVIVIDRDGQKGSSLNDKPLNRSGASTHWSDGLPSVPSGRTVPCVVLTCLPRTF